MALLALVVAGCSGFDAGGDHPREGFPRIESGVSFDEKINESWRSRTDLKLSDITDFSWTTVSVVFEGDPAEEIERVTGRRIFDEGFGSSHMLYIFCEAGQVVRMISSNAPVQTVGVSTFGHDAGIEWFDDPDSYPLWLRNPDGGEVTPDCS